MLNALKTMSLSEIVVSCAGALIGILGFSKVLNYLLEHHEGITKMCIRDSLRIKK